jgi:hypothetical protein
MQHIRQGERDLPQWVIDLEQQRQLDIAESPPLEPSREDSSRMADALQQMEECPAYFDGLAHDIQAHQVERASTERQAQARAARRNPNRLPLSGVAMTRRPGQDWSPADPAERLAPADRAAMRTYRATHRILLPARPTVARSHRPRERREGLHRRSTRGSPSSSDDGPSDEPPGLAGRLLPFLWRLAQLLSRLETPADPWAIRELPCGLWRARRALCHTLERIEERGA